GSRPPARSRRPDVPARAAPRSGGPEARTPRALVARGRRRMRLGRIGYINGNPVYGATDRGAVPVPAELGTGTPAELNDLLVAGELELSVISAVEFARHSDALQLLPGIGITSDVPVKSVALFIRRPVGQLDRRTVLLTASSRTAVALLEQLCRDGRKCQRRFCRARA